MEADCCTIGHEHPNFYACVQYRTGYTVLLFRWNRWEEINYNKFVSVSNKDRFQVPKLYKCIYIVYRQMNVKDQLCLYATCPVVIRNLLYKALRSVKQRLSFSITIKYSYYLLKTSKDDGNIIHGRTWRNGQRNLCSRSPQLALHFSNSHRKIL
jgi:hypothetical protein